MAPGPDAQAQREVIAEKLTDWIFRRFGTLAGTSTYTDGADEILDALSAEGMVVRRESEELNEKESQALLELLTGRPFEAWLSVVTKLRARTDRGEVKSG